MKSGAKNSPVSIPPLKLERILGLTSVNNATVATSSSGDVYYAAGCLAVKYNPDDNKQKFFFKATKPISSLALSKDGRYLAIGERGHNPSILVYDVIKETCLTTLTNHHKHGVGCLAFSPDNRHLVSVGFKHDKQLLVWEWDVSRKLSTQKVGNKVHSISYHSSGEYFITAGDRHLKWWYVNDVLDGEAIAIEGKAASILEDQRLSVFVDVVCGSGSLEHLTYCTTSTGMLCVFNEERVVSKWVQLESVSSYCLELFSEPGTPGLLVVGCADGVVRCYTPSNLDYLSDIPLPAVLPPVHPNDSVKYAACLALRRVTGSKLSPVPKLGAVYADHSLFVWDITDIYSVAKYRSFQFHHGCIWDLQFIESERGTRKLPSGSFVTCSSDNSIKIWNTDPKAQRESKFKSIYSREMLHSIDLLDEDAHKRVNRSAVTASVASTVSSFTMNMQQSDEQSDAGLDISKGFIDTEFPSRPQHPDAPRCLAVHPFATELAVGSKTGLIRIFDLSTMNQTLCSEAHAAEILSLNFSPPMVSADQKYWFVKNEDDETLPDDESALVMLASAGRDRLVHVFNASGEYNHIRTLDHHSSSVTIVRFTSDGKRLISCGGDKNMVFNSVNGVHIEKLKSIATPNGSVNGLAIEASNKFAVTSGQDKRLNIWNVQSGKHMRAYKSESTQELYKSDIDPSGTYIATCSFDKSVSIYDFFSGELVTQVTGHSELVTGVRFSPDGRNLLTIGGDGCIMIWKISEALVKVMQDRLVEMLTRAQKQSNKAQLRASIEQQRPATTSSVPPPPAPAASSSSNPSGQVENFMPPAPPVTERPVTAAPAVKKWGNKSDVSDGSGYELFGKKIVPVAHNAKKFTVELSDSMVIRDFTPEKAQKPASTPVPVSPNRLANSIEAKDDVMLSALSDDEHHHGSNNKKEVNSDDDTEEGSDDDEDGSYLFKPAPEEYESDFEKEEGAEGGVSNSGTQKSTTSVKSKSEADADVLLSKAQDRVVNLEKSTEQMENWLANMLRGESKLDASVQDNIASVTTSSPGLNPPTKVEGSAPANRRVVKRTVLDISMEEDTVTQVHAGGDSHEDHLNQSLSSTFFKSLRTSKALDAHTKGPSNDSSTVPVPPLATIAERLETSGEVSREEKNEMKLKDRAATVARMKERLRVMGIEKAKKAEAAAALNTPTGSAGTGSGQFMPPPPPQDESSPGYESDRTADGPSDSESDKVSKSTLNSTEVIAKKLQAKANTYRQTLNELERAKQKAAQSFQELVGLRNNLEESISLSQGSNKTLDVSKSIVESDELLSLFRASLAMLSETHQPQGFGGTSTNSLGQQTQFGSGMSRVSEASEVEVNSILEKYSDKLVQMVSEKMIGKLNNK